MENGNQPETGRILEKITSKKSEKGSESEECGGGWIGGGRRPQGPTKASTKGF